MSGATPLVDDMSEYVCLLQLSYNPNMSIGKVWIYCLLFVRFFVCTVTDFSGEDKASGVKFCMVVQGHPGQRISHFGELCSPRSPKSQCSIGMCG